MALIEIFLIAGFPALVLSQSSQDAGVAQHQYAFDSAGAETVEIKVRSDNVVIQGTDENTVVVRGRTPSAILPADLKVEWQLHGSVAQLRVHGGPSSDVGLHIEIPTRMALHVSMHSGSLTVRGQAGDIDVSMGSGNLEIAMADPSNYARVHGSVWSGAVSCPLLHIDKGGLFRSFTWTGTGQHTLQASLKTGRITLSPPAN